MYNVTLRRSLCINKQHNIENLMIFDTYENFFDDQYYSDDNTSYDLSSLFSIIENNGLDATSPLSDYRISNFQTRKDDLSFEKKSVIFQIEAIKVYINQVKNAKADKNTIPLEDIIQKGLFDERLHGILLILFRLNRPISKDLFFLHIKDCFSECVTTIIEKKQYDFDSVRTLRLYGQLLRYYLLTFFYSEDNKPRKKNVDMEAISYMAYMISSVMYKKKMYTDGLAIAKKALYISAPHERSIAYQYLGLLAIESGDLQLAYDSYLSWLKRQPIGIIETFDSVKSFINDISETEFRKSEENGIRRFILMNGNLAYVCGRISNTYEVTSKQGKNFYDLGIKYRSIANKHGNENGWCYLSHGIMYVDDMYYNISKDSKKDESMLTHLNNLSKSLVLFENARKYLNKYMDGERILNSYRLSCMALMEILLLKHCQGNVINWEDSNLLETYNKLKNCADDYSRVNVLDKSSDNGIICDQLKYREELLPVLKFYGKRRISKSNKLSSQDKIHILLLAIRQNVTIMERYLRRREYISTAYSTRENDKEQNRDDSKVIAYYTTLKNFSYIFDELYLDEHSKIPKIDKNHEKSGTKNCFTLMNAKYMNDPDEGVVLPKVLTESLTPNLLFSGKEAVNFTKNIFDENLVFLKSFTEEIDKLTMWNRYASDYDGDGKNSNGCCVLVAPECLVNFISNSKTEEILSSCDCDDYHLYRVVYLSSDGQLDEKRNPGLHPNVFELYKNLRSLIIQLHVYVELYTKSINNKKDKNDFCSIIEKSLSESFRKITFLFKYDGYSDEQESRMILLRDKNHQDDIRIIESNLPMLAINPFFQVFVSGIYFGPNVRDSEKWKPYFQYELNRMWEKYTVSDAPQKRYEIMNSDIKYLT